MTAIVYPPGAFGSMIEAVLRRFTVEHKSLDTITTNADGSSHNYYRGAHVFEINNSISEVDDCVFSAIYPGYNENIEQAFGDLNQHPSTKIAVTLLNNDDMIRCWCLFNHKDRLLERDNRLFRAINQPTNLQGWGKTDFDELETWQKREYLSYILDGIFDNTIRASYSLPNNWYTVQFQNLLTRPVAVFEQLIKDLKWNAVDWQEFEQYAHSWQQQQLAILKTADSIIRTVEFKETGALEFDLMEQAIVQQQLRKQGYEIQCDGLNEFPKSVKKLQSLLQKT